jgi:hypothetical protein
MLAGQDPGEGAMHVVGLDHVVVNTQDVERAMYFYHVVHVGGLSRSSPIARP